MSQYETNPQQPERSAPAQPPRRRQRKPPKPPIKELAICAAVIFALGFLTGFLIRGAFIPRQENTTQTPKPDQTQATDPVTAPPADPTEVPASNGTEDGWQLKLVNSWSTIGEDYPVEPVQVNIYHSVDRKCYDDLMAMMDAMKAEGLLPAVCSGYRTWQEQEELYQSKVDELMQQGMTREAAEEEAATIVAIPGTSEHQLGLAVDIVDNDYWHLDENQEKTEVQKWLLENCWDYGFILRYPNDKSEITGIIYEPWHYRYVGREIALEMKELDMCLEEYVVYLEQKA